MAWREVKTSSAGDGNKILSLARHHWSPIDSKSARSTDQREVLAIIFWYVQLRNLNKWLLLATMIVNLSSSTVRKLVSKTNNSFNIIEANALFSSFQATRSRLWLLQGPVIRRYCKQTCHSLSRRVMIAEQNPLKQVVIPYDICSVSDLERV